MAIADVTVRGAGVFGLCIAWTCVQRGALVQLIDPNGAGSGASGGIVGALAPHVPDQWNPKKQFQLEALLMASEFWSRVSSASGLPTGYRRSGRIQPVADDLVDLARRRAIAAEVNWKGQADWHVEKGPWGWQIRDTLSALIHPRLAVAALVGALAGLGVRVVAEGTDQGTVVHATGWQGLVEGGWGRGEKGQAVLLDFDLRGQPQIFADGLHIIPHDNGTVAIGSISERVFTDPKSTDSNVDDLLRRALAVMPELADAPVIERWAGVRPKAKSRAPLLGAWPGREGHFVANGGFKIGFGVAPKVAEVMADLVLDGRDGIPLGFQPPK